ncbi:MAG: D-alanyl-D-alanine carboxypeptidase [Hespellia sp.]|nr:D-alanyl-D-alanine carboxypeptidase [Hespellia sp.]
MRCTNKIIRNVVALCSCTFLLAGCAADTAYTTEYELGKYNTNLYQGDLFAANLCVTNTDIGLEGYTTDDSLHAAGLFDIANHQVLYSDKVFDQLYPASTTKLMTAYIVLKYGNLDDIVTVSENATQFEAGAQLCGLQAGDQLSMNDLLNGLLLYSGNDNAVAIAEHVSGSVEAFAERMNQEAVNLGATHTHFVNPHGLHEDNHYTTAYDLYLIFNACIQDQRFLDIVSQDSYTASITNPASGTREAVWTPTNYYSLGKTAMPDGVKVFGGKTGTTDEAGSCVILYSQNDAGNPYISIVMGAPDKTTLYNDTTSLLTAGVSK